MFARHFNTTEYSIRKLIKQLEAEGLVCKNSLTKTARETETYKQCEITVLNKHISGLRENLKMSEVKKMSKNELLPCPFCGGNAMMVNTDV